MKVIKKGDRYTPKDGEKLFLNVYGKLYPVVIEEALRNSCSTCILGGTDIICDDWLEYPIKDAEYYLCPRLLEEDLE